MIDDFELEKLEKRYLDAIITNLRQDTKILLNGLNSRIEILDDWKEQFFKTARPGQKHPSDLDAGAEKDISPHFYRYI